MIYVLFFVSFDHYAFFDLVSASADHEKLVSLQRSLCSKKTHRFGDVPLFTFDAHQQEMEGYRGRSHFVVYEVRDGEMNKYA